MVYTCTSINQRTGKGSDSRTHTVACEVRAGVDKSCGCVLATVERVADQRAARDDVIEVEDLQYGKLPSAKL